MEHRWGERLSVRTRVALRAHGGLQGIGYIRDVSLSGALLVTGVPASSMSCVKIFLTDSASTSPTSIEGQVVRHTENGFAVEWCEFAPEAVRSLVVPSVVPHAREARGELRSKQKNLRRAVEP